jgi:hypothetical protein
MESIIDKYTDPTAPGSFTAISGFLNNNKKINKLEGTKELGKLDSVTLHEPKKLKFQRCKVQVAGIDAQWQIDLIDCHDIAGSNYGNKYIFTCIDVFSKHAWAKPIKNKEAKSCLDAFKAILNESKRKPNHLYLDNGKFLVVLISSALINIFNF